MYEPYLILGVGELLWDLLPSGPQLGGAPANFAVMAGRMGNHAVILSGIGRDELGRKAVEHLKQYSVDASFLKIDDKYETGRVTVALNNGQPRYTIHQPAAWDAMPMSDEWTRLAERADAICFGSLAQRSLESRQTIQMLVAQSSERCLRVFDANLRDPFYSGEVIQESLELATVVKMNDQEMPRVLTLAGLPVTGRGDRLRHGAEQLLKEFPNLHMAAITRGENGSLLVTRNGSSEHSGIPVQVRDTIGAGDAFTAAITHYLLRGADLSTLNEAGNQWGSWMASQKGAMPELSEETRKAITNAIEG